MSIVNTRMLALRAKGNLDKYEYRPSRYGGLDLFMAQTNQPGSIITSDLKAKAEKSVGRTFETPVFDFDGGVTIGNTLSAVIADDENTTRMLQILFATYSFGFTMVPAAFMNNEVSMQEDFEVKFMKYLYKFAETLDSACIAALIANQSVVVNDPLLYTLGVDGKIAGTYADRENILGDLIPMMASNDYYGQMHIVGNTGIDAMVRKLAENGLYNAVNKQLEYADKIFHFTNRLPNATGKFATGFAVNGASFGMLTRFEREAILRTKAKTGHEWDVDTLPLINMPVSTYYYESVGDFSSIAGAATADMTRVRKQHYGFAVDVAIVAPFNSDPATRPNPVIAFDIAKV